MVEIESERTARNRELEMFGRVGPNLPLPRLASKSKDANQGHQASGCMIAPTPVFMQRREQNEPYGGRVPGAPLLRAGRERSGNRTIPGSRRARASESE